MSLLVVAVGGENSITTSGSDAVNFLGLGTLNITGTATAPISVILTQVVGISVLDTVNITDANVTLDGAAGATALVNYNIGSNGRLSLSNAVGISAGTTFSFVANNGVLAFGNSVNLALLGGIRGFGSSNKIDISQVASRLTYTSNPGADAGGFISLFDSANTKIGTLSLLTGSFTTANFSLQADGSGGTLLTTVPPAPGFLALAPSSDSGLIGDDLTNVQNPIITGTGISGDSINLYDATSLIGTAIVGSAGVWSIMPTVTLADGPHNLTAKQGNSAGNLSAASANLMIVINTTSPGAPTLVDVSLHSEPAKPVVSGEGSAGDRITLYDGAATVGTTTVGNDGTWTYSFPAALGLGSHVLKAGDSDSAGNSSPLSAPLGISVAADGSYTVTSINSVGNSIARVYNAGSQLTTITTTSPTGLLLESVGNTSALLNIYDNSGTLIGTVIQPSTSASSQPAFSTTPGDLAATTYTGSLANSQVNLLSEGNTLYSQGADSISGGPGADTIFSTGSHSLVQTGTGTAYVVLSGGSDTITAQAGISSINAVAGDDVYLGSNNAATLFVGATSNVAAMSTVFGGGGNSTVFGEAGVVYVEGSGENLYVGGVAAVLAADGVPAASMFTSTITATTGHDTIFGGAGTNSTLNLNQGQELFVAGGASDTLSGGSFAPTLIGGSNEDVKLLGTASGSILVAQGAADTIDATSASQHSDFFVNNRNGLGNTTFLGSVAVPNNAIGAGDLFIVSSVTGAAGTAHAITIENYQTHDAFFLSGYSAADGATFATAVSAATPSGSLSVTLSDNTTINFIGNHPTTTFNGGTVAT